jgi:phospholipid/cholesterol/gamma-HCH transport system permease protein
VAIDGCVRISIILFTEDAELTDHRVPAELRDGATVRFTGFIDASDCEFLEDLFRSSRVRLSASRGAVLDFSACRGLDSVAAVTIFQFIRSLENTGVVVTLDGLGKDGSDQFDSFRNNEPRTVVVRRDESVREHFEDVGDHLIRFMGTVKGLWKFGCRTISEFVRTFGKPALVRWPQVFYYMDQAGIRAIPIIGVLCWLLGTILGYQAGYQMRNFGAELYMPALIAYSITWEIGPMLAAVLVAGRSGSAFAAEIGTMQVRQEVDALSVMGINIYSYLVIPKMVALMFVMPFLVLLANIAGLVGGLLAGGVFLGMPANIYLSELSKALIPMDIYWGMLKGILYAIIVSTTGCYMGMRVRGGAAAVGRATTSAVVLSIFLVIVCDALLSILFIHIRPGLSL